MNTLAHLYPGDDAVRLAASVVAQIAGIVLVSLLVSLTFARRNAALRDSVWKAALVLVCVAPLAAWTVQRAGLAVWRVPGSRIRENSGVAAPTKPEVSRLPLPAAQPPTPTRSVSDEPATLARIASEGSPPARPKPEPVRLERAPLMHEIIIGAIAGIWAVGAVILIMRLVVGVQIVSRLCRELVPFGELPASVIDRLRRMLGVATLPPIMLSRRIGGPATLGLWRPIVVLPADLAAKMSTDELHDALAHECAHALRHDTRIALVQQIVAALYWLHPFIHFLNRQLSRAREEVCDNVVLAGTPAANYARSLLSLAQFVQSTRGRIAVVPMFDRHWRLAPRVAGL
jgi:beta-lactamase regulating signal transducer with metallopeptidase domain